MALARTQVGTYQSATAHGTAAFVTPAFTPPSNSILVVRVAHIVTPSKDPGRPTISGGGWTYTQRSFASFNTSWSIQQTVFTAPVTTGASMTLTVDDEDNDSVELWIVEVLAYTGYDTSTPIAGAVNSGAVNIGDGAESQTLTASPVSADESLVFIQVSTDSSPPNPTLASGWTILNNAGTAGYIQIASAYRGSSTSTTVDVTDVYDSAAAFYWGTMISLIVKAAAGAPSEAVQVPATFPPTRFGPF